MQDRTSKESGAIILDRDRVESVLWSVWQEYLRDFESSPVREIQELRAFSILWAILFIPEAISPCFRRSLTSTVQQYRERTDYKSFCWYRMGPIEAALYALTGVDSWLSTLRANLDHHKSDLREITIESFALLADRLEFDAETLVHIQGNFESRQFFYDWPVILFAVSKASAQNKRQKIEQWLERYKMNDQTLLEKLVRGEWVENPFLERVLRTQRYLTLRMACLSVVPEQLNLYEEWDRIGLGTNDENSEQLRLFADKSGDLGKVVWDRLRTHPLTEPRIKITDRSRADQSGGRCDKRIHRLL
jgi:hypothetical protein